MAGVPSNGNGKAHLWGTSSLLQAVTADRTRVVGFLSAGCQPRHMLTAWMSQAVIFPGTYFLCGFVSCHIRVDDKELRKHFEQFGTVQDISKCNSVRTASFASSGRRNFQTEAGCHRGHEPKDREAQGRSGGLSDR